MLRLIVIAALASTATLALATDANAERDRWRAGTVGTVTAYELDGRTVIENKQCFKSGRITYNYSSCLSRLRDDVKRELCRKQGSGTHSYLTQIGDNRPTRSSVYCSRRY